MKNKLTLLAVALFGMGCVTAVETMTGTLFPEDYTVKKQQSGIGSAENVSELKGALPMCEITSNPTK